MWLFGEGFGDRHCSLEKVSSFLDSALRDREMQRVEAHLASCTDCAQQVEEMKSVVGLLRMMPTEPSPRTFAIPVPARVFVAEPARPWWRPAPMVGLRAMVAAAAIPSWRPAPMVGFRAMAAAAAIPSWRPAPMVGFRAMAAAAAIALAVVFAGDASGVIGTPEVPIQLGSLEQSELIGSGTPIGPEQPQILGPAPVLDPAPGDAGATDIPGAETTPPADATLPEHSWFRFELWPLEIGLLALTAVMAAVSVLLRRRSASS
jgi:hypothetical protein